jgi:glucosamine--fructose-6-phosphate aminotransferase (isomerizing)
MAPSIKAELQGSQTLMYQEAAEAPNRVAAMLGENTALIRSAVADIKAYQPRWVETLARGSSDHAATYAKYLFETRLGLSCASAAPSIAAVYHAQTRLDETLYIAISQSGASPDILSSVSLAKRRGALTVALVNVEDSALAELADIVIPLRAGTEKSVAATKSYIAALASIYQLVANLSDAEDLLAGLDELPKLLTQAWALSWQPVAMPVMREASNMFIVGRGLGFAVAQEMALKLKETCCLHAEAFSSAELRHGPMAIVGRGFPVLFIAQQDETRVGMDALVEELRARGAVVLYAAAGECGEHSLAVVDSAPPALAPILAVQSFYKMANALSLARNLNPDQPPYLNKITETL